MRSVADGTGNRPDRAEPVGMEDGRFGRDGTAALGYHDADLRMRVKQEVLGSVLGQNLVPGLS